MLHYHTIQPKIKSEKPPVLIIMHGFGANELDLVSIAEQIDPRYLAISLRAPISLSWGGFAWYHLSQTPRGILPDDTSRLESEELVTGSLEGIIKREGGDPSKVVLMGFSQGAAMCYSLMTKYDLSKYGIMVNGVIAMSGYLPRDILSTLGTKDFHRLPFFISHGKYDELIPIMAIDEAENLLKEQNADVTAKRYAVGHGVLPETVADVRSWFTTHFA